MNSKKRCTFCKCYFPAEDMIKVPAGNFCTKNHLFEYGIKRTDALLKTSRKETEKKHAKRKKDFYLNDRKTRLKATKEACHAYIRARDKGKCCPDCNKPLGEHFHAGHFFESGNNPLIRYDENNIHGQLGQCNYFRDDPIAFKETIIERIGIKKLARLERLKGGKDVKTASHLLHIEQHYKKKLKALAKT